MTDEPTKHDTQTQLVDLIKNARIAMFTTQGDDGQLIGRPMGMQAAEFDGDLWFFTSKDSRKAQQIQSSPQVGITFSDEKHSSWVSLSGRAELVDDITKAKELWNPLLKAWFPDGVESPNLILIKVHADGAEYWDSPTSKVVTLMSMLKGAVTGKPADPGQNEVVDL